jgi:hypothetical protein
MHFKLNFKKANQEYFILDLNDAFYIILEEKMHFLVTILPTKKESELSQDAWCLN